MLSPKRTKYRKYHRGRMRGKATRGNEITFGDYGLQALEPTWITSRQIEAARRTITRYTKRGASLWIRIFPDKSVTARAAGRTSTFSASGQTVPGDTCITGTSIPRDASSERAKMASDP